MKRNTITIIALLITLTANSQLEAGIRAGYSFKTVDAFVAPSIGYAFNGFRITGEIMTNVKQDAPVNFGMQASYQYRFIEVGFGEWYMLYSLDAYDKNRNKGWVESAFIAAHYKTAFIKVEYLNEVKASVGVRMNIF